MELKFTETDYFQKMQLIAHKEILSFREELVYLDVSESFLYKLTSERAIEFTKPNGGKLYFKKSDLVNAWKLADEKGVADVLRKNPEFLKHYDELTDNTTLKKHVFDGEINKKNSVKGGHFDESFYGNNFRLGDGTTDLS